MEILYKTINWANRDIAFMAFLKFYDKVGEFYGRISCGS